MQVIFLPSDQLPCFGSGPCLRLGGVLYCDYEVLKLPAHQIRAVLVAHRLKPEKEVVRVFGLRAEGSKILVVARSIMAPLNEVSRLREFQFRIAGKWWEVVYGVEAGFSGPGFSGFKGFSGLLSGPEFTGLPGSISREFTLSGYPDARRELSEGQPFNLPWLESRSPNSSLAISEDLLLARLQTKLRLLKGVKRLRNRQEWKATLDKVQLGLDVAGMVPVIGNAADLLNLCISLGRGNYGEAAMNAVSMLPGSQVVTGAKLAIRSGRRWRKAGRMKLGTAGALPGSTAARKGDEVPGFYETSGSKKPDVPNQPIVAKGEEVIELKGGSKGGWNQELNGPLKAKAKYKVDNYIYETDDLGRVNKVSGELELKNRGRLKHQQTNSVKWKDGIEGDQGGHLIAQIFNGPGEQINYVPMKGSEVNLGQWRMLENKWQSALREGKRVSVEINLKYGTTKRPEKFIVKYNIDKMFKKTTIPNV